MGRRFLDERRRDPYYRGAQRAGLRSRAAYKLAYLIERFGVIRPGSRVLDLGAAPGGWSIVARAAGGAKGSVVAVDVRPIDPIPGVRTVRARVGDPALGARLGARSFDVVLSDMSPRISGAYATDHARSVALARDAWGLARTVLRANGTFVAKVFDGEMVEGLLVELERAFDRVHRTKPPASRERSSEVYVVAQGFRGGGPAHGRAGVPGGRGSDI